MVVRPATGGMKAQALTLAEVLTSHGEHVEVAGPAGSDVVREARERGLTAHELSLVDRVDPKHDAAAVIALTKLLRAGGYDLAHAHGFKASLVTRAAAAFTATPVVVTVHNHVLYREETSRLVKWGHTRAERYFAVRPSAYIAVSESLERELVSAYHVPATRVSTVHNGVAPAAFMTPVNRADARRSLGIPQGARVLGTACRFAPQKGLDVLLDALPEIRQGVPDVLLVLGGAGPLADELKQRAADRGVAQHVLWPGMIADMPRFLAALDVYVSSSRSEGLPLALVETAAAGVPTVATAVGGTPEIVVNNETGLLVEAENPHALAEACADLLLDSERAAALARRARDRALDEFAPEAMVERTMRVYERVVSHAAAPPRGSVSAGART